VCSDGCGQREAGSGTARLGTPYIYIYLCFVNFFLGLRSTVLLCEELIHISLFFCMELQEPNVSMIITDYWMPEMTGYELLKKVKVTQSLTLPGTECM
jgi:CheY-like chemotaxis protein